MPRNIRCPSCGATTGAENRFCTVCGRPLTQESPRTPVTSAAPRQPASRTRLFLIVGGAVALTCMACFVVGLIVTSTPSYKATATAGAISRMTEDVRPTETPGPTATLAPSDTPTPAETQTPTPTPTSTETQTPAGTQTPAPTPTLRPTSTPAPSPTSRPLRAKLGWLCDFDRTGWIRLWTAASMQATVKDVVGTCVACCVDVNVYEQQEANLIIFYHISVGGQSGWVDVDYFYWDKPSWCRN